MTISVVLAGDQVTVRRGLRLVIGARPDPRVAGEAAAGREAAEPAVRPVSAGTVRRAR